MGQTIDLLILPATTAVDSRLGRVFAARETFTKRDLLSLWEGVDLLSIWELKGEAYGVAIKRLASRKTGRILSYGGLYFALAQLAKKGARGGVHSYRRDSTGSVRAALTARKLIVRKVRAKTRRPEPAKIHQERRIL